MKKKLSAKENADRINNMCVKTYLEILGYRGITSARGYAVFASPLGDHGSLYVDFDTKKFRLSHGRRKGGVLDLAAALFKVSKAEILRNAAFYGIDRLIDKCGDRRGANQ